MSFAFLEETTETPLVAAQKGGIYRQAGKRLFDLLAVALAAPFVVPIVFLAWWLMKRDGGNGFYSQPRVGLDGRVFNCWKVRSMVPYADMALDILKKRDPEIEDEWERTQKLKEDPRITRWGKLFRKTSIDELPQLWNVLIGDMSLLGPRPFTPNQTALYDGASDNRKYYTVRPGLSGLWQVESRNDGSFTDRVTYDEHYCQNIGFKSDLRLILKTVLVLTSATGK